MTTVDGQWEQARREIREDMRQGFDRLDARLAELVTSRTFESELRRIDDKLVGLEDDVEKLFAARDADRRRRSQDVMVWAVAGIGWLLTLVIAALPLLRK